ncbi:hypothetical protein M569_17401 [Genlisea aurea]|uniref:Uncharacterized protein n=1 Tax=Genlisea aurea TaxID=192259 RepID=S8DDL1_9LAMI|nr:hypothetical protein M569_17401 [Genlisea aurea]
MSEPISADKTINSAYETLYVRARYTLRDFLTSEPISAYKTFTSESLSTYETSYVPFYCSLRYFLPPSFSHPTGFSYFRAYISLRHFKSISPYETFYVRAYFTLRDFLTSEPI